MNSISVVIPAYNEEQRLPVTLGKVTEYLCARKWTFSETIVVDDGSSDGTAQLVWRLSKADPSIRLIQNPGNRGKGYSVRNGVLAARADWILFTDADLSAPIEELDKLFAGIRQQEARIAIGSRALDRSLIGIHQSFFREQAGRVFNTFVRLMTGLPFWDTQCGFKLFESQAAREVFGRQELEGFGFDVEILFIARLLGYRTVEVPVRWNHSEGTKVRMLSDSLNMFLDLIRIRINQIRGRYR